MLTRDSHTQGNSTRSRRQQEALKSLERGMRVLPLYGIDDNGNCTCGNQKCKEPGKHPLGRLAPNGVHSATRDESRITGWFNKAPWMNYGVVDDTTAVLDQDGQGAIREAEQRGKPETLEVATGRVDGGRHTYLKVPKGTKSHSPGPGLELRVGNQYVVGVGCRHSSGATYEVVNRADEIASAPEWVLEKPEAPNRPQTGVAPRKINLPDAGPIHNGGRHNELARIAGRLHDGTRSLDQITQELLEINANRCVPPIGSPGDDPLEDVARIARWIYGKEPCRTPREQGPEVNEFLQRISDDWYRRYLRGGGRSKLRDVRRAILKSAAKRRELGKVVVDGVELQGALFSDSYRQVGEAARTSAMSACRHMRKLEKAGEIVKVQAPDGLAATWLLIDTAQKCYTPNYSFSFKKEREVDGGVTLTRADELVTPMRGWLHPVGNAGSGIEAALEGYGPLTTVELADRLGYTRPRDLERRHLRRLVKLGVIEHQGGKWVRSEDRERHDRLREEPFATVHRKRVRRRTSEGRKVVEVVETVKVASERERCQERREKHVDQRRDWRARRILRNRVRDDAGDVAFEELPPATMEMLSANRVGRYLLARGWRRFDKRLWVHPGTAEIMPVDRAMEEAA